ncbi:hypothetical protein D3C72_737570 [compost metagenome]
MVKAALIAAVPAVAHDTFEVRAVLQAERADEAKIVPLSTLPPELGRRQDEDLHHLVERTRSPDGLEGVQSGVAPFIDQPRAVDHQLGDQVVLRSEIIVQRRAVALPRRRQDVANGHGVYAARGEQALRGPLDRLASDVCLLSFHGLTT